MWQNTPPPPPTQCVPSDTVLLSVYAYHVVLALVINISTSTPKLIAKRSVVQKIYDRQRVSEVLNPHCDLDLEQKNQMFTEDIPSYDDIPSN